MKQIEKNISKIFWFSLTQRRNYITILSLYFLTLPNTTANQIGLYTGIANVLAFFFEIPSGYFADVFGHKKTLILAKVLLIISTASFIFIPNFYGFLLGMSGFTLALACTSGTKSAFMHETLSELWKEQKYAKIMGNIWGKVSLISMFLIILLPFLTKINYTVPLYMTLVFDIVWLFVAISFIEPKKQKHIDAIGIQSIWNIFKDTIRINIFPFLLLTSAPLWLLIWESSFRYLYLEELWYPVIYVGFVMGLSRWARYVFSRYIHIFEKYIDFRKFVFLELLFPITCILAAFFNNPYIIAGIIIVMLWYLWGRKPIIDGYILNKYKIDKNYKATILSFQGQMTLIFQVVSTFGLGYIMSISYKLWYYSLGVSLFLIIGISTLFLRKQKDTSS